MTLSERVEAARAAWRRYQADASRAGRADVPSLDAYWEALYEIHYPPEEEE